MNWKDGQSGGSASRSNSARKAREAPSEADKSLPEALRPSKSQTISIDSIITQRPPTIKLFQSTSGVNYDRAAVSGPSSSSSVLHRMDPFYPTKPESLTPSLSTKHSSRKPKNTNANTSRTVANRNVHVSGRSAGPTQGSSNSTRPQILSPLANVGYASMRLMKLPVTKAASDAPPMWNPDNEPRGLLINNTLPPVATVPKKRQPIQIMKGTDVPKPFWQHQDYDYESRQKVGRRKNKAGDLNFIDSVQRKSTATPRKAYLNRMFEVVQEPDPNRNSDEEEEEEDDRMDIDEPVHGPKPNHPPQRKPSEPMKIIPSRDLSTFKAARKRENLTPSPSETSDDNSDEESSDKDTLSSDRDSNESVLELTDSDSESEHQDAEEQGVSDEEITIIEHPPPSITIPLPQIIPTTSRVASQPFGPPEALLNAISKLVKPSLRMQKTSQLPFLRRNVRKGFRNRCSTLGVKITKHKPKIPILVRYQHLEHTFETHMTRWSCPMCELHGAFANSDMLKCHLYWDHPEVILERWEQRMNNQGKSEWLVRILVPEMIQEAQYKRVMHSVPQLEGRLEGRTIVKNEPREHSLSQTFGERTQSPPARIKTEPPGSPSPTPSQSMTPTPLRSATLESMDFVDSRATSFVEETDSKTNILKKLEPVRVSTIKGNRSNETPQRRFSSPMSFSRSRSVMTFNTETEGSGSGDLFYTHQELKPAPPGGLYPSPPPEHDPLGPAARSPYLPATSDNGGPDVYYSCRPGGPTLFDLLNTLPMEPYGVLDWAILEREEEIFESDEVKDELKVMQALWLRWITLHKNVMIANYYKGVLSFVENNWRMIHLAAGWKALRDWLLCLMACKFLSVRDVAKILKYYEEHTGMAPGE